MLVLAPLWRAPTAAGEDDLVYFFPTRVLVGRCLAQWQWPVWNPYQQCGMSLAADPQSAVLYPPTWLFAAIGPKTAYAMNIFIAFALAGLGAWAYLRRLGLAAPAALLGATAFQYGGFMVAHRVHLGMISTAAFLPWGLWAIELMRERPRQALPAWSAAALGGLSAGHFPIFINMSLCWVVYLLVRGRPRRRCLPVAVGGVALAALGALPQLTATFDLLAQVTRARVGLAVAGENSFPPTNFILALFPLIMGCRTSNALVHQPWWGPWHLCETLGYVGLLTLPLATGALWRLWRRCAAGPWSGPVKLWGLMLAGAAVLMLGYYLPPVFRVVHALPILSIVRVPARWLLVADMALASLAAIALHVLIRGATSVPGATAALFAAVRSAPRPERRSNGSQQDLPLPAGGKSVPTQSTGEGLPNPVGPFGLRGDRVHGCKQRSRGTRPGPPPGLARTVRRLATIGLPAAMAASLALMAGLTAVFARWYPQRFGEPFVGGPSDVWRALRPVNPALWVPLVVLGVTIATVAAFLRHPRRLAWLPAVVLLADLAIVARAVDIPGDLSTTADPTVSAAAAVVRADATGEPFRVLHLTGDYYLQPADALAPHASAVFGVESLAGYGPFQTPRHAHLFGLGIYGYTRQWPWLVRRNHLLSLYNVKYILCQAPYREVIESVVIAEANTPPPPGENLLTGVWRTDRSAVREGIVHLDGARLLWPALAWQEVRAAPGEIYRIELDARCVAGAEHFLLAEVCGAGDDESSGFHDESCRLYVSADHIGRQWRHHEWTFRLPGEAPHRLQLALRTWSESAIEVRSVRLARAHWEQPVNLGGRLAPGASVYERIAVCEPSAPGGGTIHVYRNRLCLPRVYRVERTVRLADDEAMIEALRWRPESFDLTREALTAEAVGDGPRLVYSVAGDLPGAPMVERQGRANGLGMILSGPRAPTAVPAGPPATLAATGGAVLIWAGLVVRASRRRPNVARGKLGTHPIFPHG